LSGALNARDRARRSAVLVCSATAWLANACAPSLPDETGRITDPRLIAVRVDPPEASPGEDVTAHALVASSVGAVVDANLDWAICDVPKSPAENRIVNPACLSEEGTFVSDTADHSVTLTVPGDACALFGPDTPPGDFRPRDADTTGGYFLPIRVRGGGAPAIVLERISCNPRGASLDVANALREAYVPNRNPTLRSLAATTLQGQSVPLDRIPAGADIRLEAGFDAADEEPYVMFDPATGSVAVRRESLRFSFFTTSGTFESARTGPSGAEAPDGTPTSATTWHVGALPGLVHLFVVLRDSRGGVDFSATTVMVVEKGSGK